jgi:hypothetical protein
MDGGAGKFWLGDLDSNQDSQIQSLESYQLDDLPAEGDKKESQQVPGSGELRFCLSNLNGNGRCVNRRKDGLAQNPERPEGPQEPCVRVE